MKNEVRGRNWTTNRFLKKVHKTCGKRRTEAGKICNNLTDVL